MLNSDKMLNFTVGPVQSDEKILKVGGSQVPYFRTAEFSDVMFENEKLMKEFTGAEDDSRVVFLTGSGTASMEAAVMNFFDERDNVLVVNGGSFGNRFVKLCELHEIKHEVIRLDAGKTLTKEELYKYDGKPFTGFLINIHETSTGVHYDLDMVCEFCRKNSLFLVVDAISSFLADEIDVKKGIDVMLTGSQKALACAPGISVVLLRKKALERLEKYKTKCMYLDLRDALKNGERGQTPFTPAVSTLLEINTRLRDIRDKGGVREENRRIKALAEDFRQKIKGLPFEIFSESMSYAVTPLHPTTCPAKKIFLTLKDEYNIWVCPSGGDLENVIFRVGHIGALTEKDNDTLIDAFYDLKKRGII